MKEPDKVRVCRCMDALCKPGVVFLDIDGVLNDNTYLKNLLDVEGKEKFHSDEPAFLVTKIDPERVALVDRICKEGNARVVLSTHWVVLFGEKVVTSLLRKSGLKAKILGATPRKLMSERAHEINMWLDRNPTDRMVILEDVHPMYAMEERTIRTDSEVGLLEEHVERAIQILRQ